MKSTLIEQDIKQYLHVVTGGGEAGLLVASSKLQKKATSAIMEHGFQEVSDPNKLALKSFVKINEANLKFWYDVASQYPHGQIQWTDLETKEIKSLKLNPADYSLVFLCDEASLSHTPDLRTVSGAAFHFK